MRLIRIAAFAIAAAVFLAPVRAQQAPPRAPEHIMPTPQAGGMMDHDKMMADMKAADARLEALAQTMAVYVAQQEGFGDRIGLFAGIEDCRFKRAVQPGDRD